MLRAARKIVMPVVACLTVGVLFGACTLQFLWEAPPGSSLPFGLGDNGLANDTYDGNYIDVTVDANWSIQLMRAESACINLNEEFEAYNNCFMGFVGKSLPGGYIGNIISYAMQDPNCVVPGTDDPSECTYGQSMYWAAIDWIFGLGGTGCLGFRVNLLTQQFEQGSWYAEQQYSRNGTNVPLGAFCYPS